MAGPTPLSRPLGQASPRSPPGVPHGVGVRGIPSRLSRSGRGRPPPFQGPCLGPGPTEGDAGTHAVGSQALGVLRRRGGGPGTRDPAPRLMRCPQWAERRWLAVGGVGGKQELQREVLGRRAGAGLRRPGVGGPQGAAEPRSTSQRSWSGLTRLRWPPAQLVPGGPSCSSPQLGLSWGPGPLLGLPLVPGCVSWEGPAPPSGLALTCPPGELAGSVHPWPAGQGRTQWLAPAFWSSAMACPGWMSARRRSLHPAVLLGLREGEGSEGPGSPPYFRRRPCSEPWLLLRFSDRGPSISQAERASQRCPLPSGP